MTATIADFAAERIATSLSVLYGATPFWLDATTAWTVMAIKPLTAEDRSELRLANPALVLFGAGKEITDPYLAIDPDFAYRLATNNPTATKCCSATNSSA